MSTILTAHRIPPPLSINAKNEVLEESEAPEPRESPLSGEEEDSVQNVEERHFQDPAESVELVYETDVSGEGPMEKFLRKGGKFPILMLACNRVNMLVETLKVRQSSFSLFHIGFLFGHFCLSEKIKW